MIKVQIPSWDLVEMATKHPEIYEQLMALPQSSFTVKPDRFAKKEDGSIVSNYQHCEFFVNDLTKVRLELLSYCKFEPAPMLEMMGGARINTSNVFEAVKRNQIMLPNNMMLEMKELRVETDSCTDAINELMQEEWKLIAILPQHNQARPDYILGKL